MAISYHSLIEAQVTPLCGSTKAENDSPSKGGTVVAQRSRGGCPNRMIQRHPSQPDGCCPPQGGISGELDRRRGS
jgi:hypothetical protein